MVYLSVEAVGIVTPAVRRDTVGTAQVYKGNASTLETTTNNHSSIVTHENGFSKVDSYSYIKFIKN